MEYVKIYGSTTTSEVPSSLHKQEILTATVDKKQVQKIQLEDSKLFRRPVDITWLKSASVKYDISPDIKDYVIVPVPVITSDIPNANSQAFPITSLLDFCVDQKKPRFSTFVGSPTHIEHRNDDYRKAKGVNLDASLLSVNKYGVAKLIVLSAFCRQKDPQLANDIFNKKRTCYSMGAYASTLKCSICGSLFGPGTGLKPRCSCGLHYTDLNSFGRLVGSGRDKKVHYMMAIDPVFFENSSVSDPADVTAVSVPI